MKIRTGFVSNSSSSSFIVAVKTDEKVTTENLLKLLGIPEGSQGAKFFSPIIDAIVDGDDYENDEDNENREERERWQEQIAELRRQYDQTLADYNAETNKTTDFARAMSSCLKRTEKEIAELQEYIRESIEAEEDEFPFSDLKKEGGWQFLSVSTDETEGIGSLECSVIKVSYMSY